MNPENCRFTERNTQDEEDKYKSSSSNGTTSGINRFKYNVYHKYAFTTAPSV